jgi:hypothetical protein
LGSDLNVASKKPASATGSRSPSGPRNDPDGQQKLLDPGATTETQPERTVLGLKLEFQTEETAASPLEEQPLERLVRNG